MPRGTITSAIRKIIERPCRAVAGASEVAVVRHRPHRAGRLRFYGHLEKGSVAVSVGGRVAAGGTLGRRGNSGNSTNPHLHFGLLDRPGFLTAYSLPFVFEDYELTGRITGGDENGPQIARVARQVRSGYPLVGSIATLTAR